MIEQCDCCKLNKKETTKQKINKHFFTLCNECIESLKWTQACLRAGTDKILEKLPNRFIRTGIFSVTACE